MTPGIGGFTVLQPAVGTTSDPRPAPRPSPAARVAAGTVPTWRRTYPRVVAACDATVLAAVVGANVAVGLGSTSARFGSVSVALAVMTWTVTIASLKANRAWDPRVLGSGAEEFTRLLRGVLAAGVVLALLGLAVVEPVVRAWVFGVVPVAGLLMAATRLALRKQLHRRRAHGSCLDSVLAVGEAEALPQFIARTRRDHYTGWSVTGICTQTGAAADGTDTEMGVPVVGDLDSVAAVAVAGGYQAVAVGQAAGWSRTRLHQLAWDLEGTGIELVVDPGLMEIAGPRLHITPVDGLPLLRLTQPAFAGFPWLVKHVLDRLGALVLIVATLPVLAVIAVAVAADGGPVFYRQERIGRHGRPFSMIKFRSMVVDADRQQSVLRGANDGAGLLFKLKQDPRVTRVGAVLRRYSVDELPQLLNVLAGTMTLVGPRPPLPSEVAGYGPDASRRLLVRPGLTGLWQVSGRSDLSWEESVQLDLRYVENWTLALDALILWKTISVVLRGSGAY